MCQTALTNCAHQLLPGGLARQNDPQALTVAAPANCPDLCAGEAV